MTDLENVWTQCFVKIAHTFKEDIKYIILSEIVKRHAFEAQKMGPVVKLDQNIQMYSVRWSKK